MNRLKVVSLLCLMSAWLMTGTSCQRHRYRIAVSQCYHNDWNMQLLRDMQHEVSTYPEVDLHIALCTEGGAEAQMADIRRLIDQAYDAILVAPYESEGFSTVFDEASQAGIPVILIDSETTASNYTARVSCDNHDIGERLGQFALYSLKGHGKVIEMRGIEGSSVTADRHQGFAEVIQDHAGIQIIDSCYGDWTYQTAVAKIDSLVTLHPDVDLIVAHNDPMALAAYDICLLHDFENIPIIVGVDGLLGENNGIANVLDGKLAATCTNPTGGIEAIRLALDILHGRPYQHVTMLPTQLIDHNNAGVIMNQEQRIEMLNRRIEEITGKLGDYFERSNLLLMLVVTLLLIVALGGWFIGYYLRSARQRNALRMEVEQATKDKLNFFTQVSHSFRTPITLIADPIRTLQREGDLNERQLQMVNIMAHQSEELLGLVDKVLNVLQSDLLKGGADINVLASASDEELQPSASELRQRSFEPHPMIVSDQNRLTLLIIDDNPEIRHYLSLVLESRDYLVLTAPNGEEGLLVAQQNIPDLIICDVMMPIMDGLECCRRLKSSDTTSHIPVLLLTAYALDDQRIEGYRSGADAYITKPFNTDVLCARVQNLIDKRRRIDARLDRAEELTRAEFGSIDRQLVDHFHDFVTEHIDDLDLGVPQLCQEFAMSRVQLYRKCKSLTGQAPAELIRVIRLKAARELLQTSDKTVSEIAYSTGFSSPSYLAKCYKDQFGESPTDVQRRARMARGGN